jgi:hypothetical protein
MSILTEMKHVVIQQKKHSLFLSSRWSFGMLLLYNLTVASTGQEAFSFLSQLTHTNASGVAGAYTAKPLKQGMLDGIGINPAGLAFSTQKSSSNISKKWLSVGVRSGFNQDQVGYIAHSFYWKGWVWSTSLDYLFDGFIEVVDEEGAASGKTIAPFVGVPSLTLAREVHPSWKIGSTFKLPTQSLGDFEGSQWAIGWGVDLGVQYQPKWKSVQLGMSFLNLGRQETPLVQGGERGISLPAEWRMGARYKMQGVYEGYWSLDYARPLYQTPYFVLGFEKQWSPSLILRVGTRWNQQEITGGIRNLLLSENREAPERHDTKLTAGTSIDVGVLWVDYAVLYGEQLGWQHQIGIRWGY